MQQLKSLKLNNNELFGDIPKALGNLARIETFHIHMNHLTGEIPGALDTKENLGVTGLRYLGNDPTETLDTFLLGLEKEDIRELEKLNKKYFGLKKGSGLTLTNSILERYGRTKVCAPYRDEVKRNDKKAIQESWKNMGGKESKLFNGNEDYHRSWKGVEVTGFRVTALGEKNLVPRSGVN